MQVKITDYFQFLKGQLRNEQYQLFLWIPVVFAIGILCYFSLPFEPLLPYSIAASIFSLIFTIIFRKNRLLYNILLAFFFLAAGFMCANLRTISVRAPVLQKDTPILTLQGIIEDIETYKTGHRVLLNTIKFDRQANGVVPEKIRLTVFTDLGNAKAGDAIEVRASLKPPPKAVMPGAYDFARRAYFEQIGAIGHTVSDFVILRQAQDRIGDMVSHLRNSIASRLEQAIGGTTAEIAKALLIGDKGGIPPKTMDSIRNSGLAHLLAISGLHLALVCAIFFLMSRTLLVLIPRIALYYNTKKIAAVFAILGSYFYLLISGDPVSAERAFIMAALILSAIILDRVGTPMRLVAIAAMLILALSPENILSPSFQMSFGAVIGLISAFTWLTPHLNNFAEKWNIPRFFMHILGTILSSVIATLATAPYGIYHFNRASPYGILANIIAIPLTSFLIMPLGILSLLLMPLHLEWLVAWPLDASIGLVVKTAVYVSSLPYASSTIPAIHDWQLLLATFGFLWLALWQGNWRILGIPLIIIAIITSWQNQTPDIIINNDGKLFAVKSENGELLFSSKQTGRYARNVWTARSGQETSHSIYGSGSNLIRCDLAGCIYRRNGYTTAFITHSVALEKECHPNTQIDLFINLTDVKYDCARALKQINTYHLQKHGTHEIFLDKAIDIHTVVQSRNRLWEQ